MNNSNSGERFELASRPKTIQGTTTLVFFLAVALPLAVGLPFLKFSQLPKTFDQWIGPAVVLVVWVSLFICWALFPRRFVLGPDRLVIERPLRSPSVLFSSIRSVEFQPDDLKGSLRTCGNGGFLGFQGWFWNKKIGAYRAYGTDAQKAVIIRMTGSTYVVTPQEPEAFVARLKKACGLV